MQELTRCAMHTTQGVRARRRPTRSVINYLDEHHQAHDRRPGELYNVDITFEHTRHQGV